MTERMTSVHLPDHPGYGFQDVGRKHPVDMIQRLRALAERDRAAAQAILDAPDEAFIVDTYLGIHVQRQREQLWPPAVGEVQS